MNLEEGDQFWSNQRKNCMKTLSGDRFTFFTSPYRSISDNLQKGKAMSKYKGPKKGKN